MWLLLFLLGFPHYRRLVEDQATGSLIVSLSMPKEIINEVAMNITSQFEDYRIGWEFLKYKVRQLSQDYSKRKACECREKRVSLEKKIEELESNLSENSAPEEILEYRNVKAQLDNLYNYITEGAILRSKARWYEEGKTSTKCSLKLAKNNRIKTSIKN